MRQVRIVPAQCTRLGRGRQLNDLPRITLESERPQVDILGVPIPVLIEGWSRFRQGRFREQGELFERLHRQGQKPSVVMIACCDSRVDPAIVFDCDPGDLFVVLNVANLVPPFEEGGGYHGTSAALEFAVRVLGVEHIVVLGHALCGGIRSLVTGPPDVDPPMHFLPAWMSLARDAMRDPAEEAALDVDQRASQLERDAIRLSERNLMTFPAIRQSVEAGALSVHGWHFDFRDGQLMVHDRQRGRFVPADQL